METDASGNPIRDPELLRRIEKAKSSQRLRDPHAELHDPTANRIYECLGKL
jgi:hypothetical protein